MGSGHPIIIADGNNTRKEISRPLIIPFIFKSEEDNKKPITIHIEKADKFASHVNFMKIIGITSMIPAQAPKKIPFTCLFIATIHLPYFAYTPWYSVGNNRAIRSIIFLVAISSYVFLSWSLSFFVRLNCSPIRTCTEA